MYPVSFPCGLLHDMNGNNVDALIIVAYNLKVFNTLESNENENISSPACTMKWLRTDSRTLYTGDDFIPQTHQCSGVSWPSGLAYRTQVLVVAAECGFESRP